MVGHGSLGAARRGGDHTRFSRKLSLFPQSMADMGYYAANCAPTIRARTAQFDLLHVMSTNGTWGVCFHPTNVLNQSAMQSEVNTFHAADFGSMKFILHFLTVVGANPNYGTTAHWDNMAANLAKVAAVYKDSPLIEGLFWDWEYYGTSGYWGNFANAGGLTGTTDQKMDTVRSRFYDLFAGFFALWPDVWLAPTTGGSASQSAHHQYLGTGGWTISGTDVAFANDLKTTMFQGIAEAMHDAGRSARAVDGAETYGVRTQADVQRTRQFGQAMSKQNPNMGGTYFAEQWDATNKAKFNVPAAQGIYDYNNPANMPAATLQSMIASSLRQAGDLTWLYTEWYEWVGVTVSGKPTVPQTYLDAVAEGRRLGRL